MYVVLTFESVDKILWCDHSNETSLAVLLHGTICFLLFYKMKFRIVLELMILALIIHVSCWLCSTPCHSSDDEIIGRDLKLLALYPSPFYT